MHGRSENARLFNALGYLDPADRSGRLAKGVSELTERSVAGISKDRSQLGA